MFDMILSSITCVAALQLYIYVITVDYNYVIPGSGRKRKHATVSSCMAKYTISIIYSRR